MNKNLKDLVLEQKNAIDIKNCYIETGIDDILLTMEKELISLTEVKQKVREIFSVLLFDRIRELNELSKLNTSLHMAFTGRSGTGKSSVASKVALVLRNLGYLTKGHILNVTREDLVGQYVGHTAPKTREQLQKAHGGILFIDEAYQLYKPNNERDYGSEAIELLLQVMENQRDDLILIFSGPKEKTEQFFHSNPGISSRIGNHVHFNDYNINDLTEITKFILYNESRYKFTKEALDIIIFYISQFLQYSTFANVRTIKLFINQLFAYQAIRIEKLLLEKGSLNYESLTTITKDDILSLTNEDFINIIATENISLYNIKK
jgi:probable Rubsico expression protein CbbX